MCDFCKKIRDTDYNNIFEASTITKEADSTKPEIELFRLDFNVIQNEFNDCHPILNAFITYAESVYLIDKDVEIRYCPFCGQDMYEFIQFKEQK